MKKILSAFVLALIMVAFVGCGKKEAAPVEKKDLTTLEEKAGDAANEAVKAVPEATKEAVKAIPEKPKE